MKRPEGFGSPGRETQAQPPRKPDRAKRTEPPAPHRPARSSTRSPADQPKPKRAGARTSTNAPSASGAQLRKAERERRRYERNEVKRFTRRSRNRRLAWLTALGIVLALVGLVAVAVFSPILSLKTITVEGASRVSASEITAAVDGQLGTPLALVDFKRITKELARFPLIRSYVTETVPPSTLIVHIVERSPVGAIATSSGFTVVDPAGVVISRSDVRPPSLPLIDVGTASTKSAAYRAAVEVLLALPKSVLSQVDRVTAQTKDDVTFLLSGIGQRVVWGNSDRSALKARVLAALIAHQNPGVVVEYDVSAPNDAVVRPG
ncbi:MAG: FtsQ-type POTRA domain-containing protein [Lacisediminihabitans sp.]